MFCKKCGTQLADDAVFCENCGTKMREAVQEEVQPVSEVPCEEQMQSAAQQEAMSEAPAAKKKSFVKWLVIAAAALGLVLAAVLLLGGGDGGDFEGQINQNNVAHFAYDNQRLYFISYYDDTAEDTSLYSTDYNGGNKKMIRDNGAICRVRVMGGKLYCVEENAETEDKWDFYMMDTDGSNRKTIMTTDKMVWYYEVQGKTVYYLTSENVLYICDLDGNNNEEIAKDVDSFVAAKNKIYYATETEIVTYDMKSKTTSQLSDVSEANRLALKGSALYFVNDDGLCKIDVKSGEYTCVIRDSFLDFYVFQGDQIYYKQKWDISTISSLADYLADKSNSAAYWELYLFNCGSLYQANLDGSNPREVENTETALVYSLYTYPKGLYYKISAWEDNIVPVVFE